MKAPVQNRPLRKRANAFGNRKSRLYQITGSYYGEQISWRVIAANEDDAAAQAHARHISVSKCEIAKPIRAGAAHR